MYVKQLKNLGISINAVNSIQEIFNNFTDLGEPGAIEALQEVTAGYSPEVLKLASSQMTLSAAQATAIFEAKGLTGAELEQAVATATLSASQKGATASTVGLGAAFKGFGASLKAFAAAHPVLLAIVATIGAIAGTSALVDLFTTTLEEQKEKLKDAEQGYEDAKNKLSELNTELKTVTDRIKELQDKANNGTITLVEKDELKNLLEQNALIKENIKLAEEEQKKAARKFADENSKTFKKEFGDIPSDSNIESRANDLVSNDKDGTAVDTYLRNNNEEFDDLLVSYTAYSMKISDALNSGNEELAKQYELSKQEVIQLINETAGKDFNSSILSLNEYKENLLKLQNSDGSFDNESDQQFWDYIENVQKILYESNGKSGEWNTSKLDAVVSDVSLTNIMTQIQDKLNDGSLTSGDISGFGDLNDILGNTNLILEDGQSATDLFIQYLNKLKESGETVATELDSVTISLTSLNDAYEKLESNAKILSDINSEIEKSGNISADSLNKMITAYPEMTKAAYQYRRGLITEQELFSQLKNCYSEDQANYNNMIVAKNELDGSLYSAFLENHSGWVNAFNANYNIDLNNYKSLAQAKAAIDARLINELSGTWTGYYTAVKDSVTGLYTLTSNYGYDDSEITPDEDEARIAQQDAYNKYNSMISALNNITRPYMETSIADTSWSSIGGGSSSISSSSAEIEFSEQVNWFDRLTNKLSKIKDKFNNILSDAAKSWGTRSNALTTLMSNINDQIRANEQAYNDYMSQFNSYGLDAHYKDLIVNGRVGTETITDENLKNAIDEALDLYDSAIECENAVADLRTELSEMTKTRFDNVAEQFEEILGKIEAVNTQLSNEADILESKGYMASTYLYGQLIETEQDNLKKLNEERSALMNAMSGITKGTQQWYEMQSKIDDVTSSIQDATKSLVEYNNEMRQVHWDAFDYTRDSVTNLIDETEFIIGLLKNSGTTDDTGNLNDNGKAAQALMAQKYQLYLSQAQEYADEINKINAEIANDPYNQTLLDRKQELIKTQQDAINSAYSEKDAIKDLINDAYSDYKNSLDNIISKYKELINTAKSANDYQRDLAKQTKDLNALQIQYEVLKNDDSESGRKQAQSLQNQIGEAESNLEQTQYEQLISDTEKLLDDLSAETDELFNARMDDLDALIEDVIASSNLDAEHIGNTIRETAETVGYTMSDSMSSIWKTSTDNLTNVLSAYGDKFNENQTTLNNAVNSIKSFTEQMLKNSNEEAARVAAEIAAQQEAQNSSVSYDTNDYGSASSSSGSSDHSGGSSYDDIFTYKYYYPQNLNVDTSVVDRFKSNNIDASFSAISGYWNKLFGEGTYYGTYDQNIKILNWLKNNGYAKGTRSATKGIHLVAEQGNELSIKNGLIHEFSGGETVFTNNMTDNLWKFAKNPADYVHSISKFSDLVNKNSSSNVSVGDFVFHVQANNPTELVQQMRNALATDPKMKQIAKSVVFSSGLGGNSLEAKKYL